MSHITASQFTDRFVALVLQGKGVPKKDSDRHILLFSATLGLDPNRHYAENELNDHLRAWSTRFGAPFDLDHVTLRRYLIDEQYLARDAAGTTYTLTTGDFAYAFDPTIQELNLDALLSAARREREERKQRYLKNAKG